MVLVQQLNEHYAAVTPSSNEAVAQAEPEQKPEEESEHEDDKDEKEEMQVEQSVPAPAPDQQQHVEARAEVVVVESAAQPEPVAEVTDTVVQLPAEVEEESAVSADTPAASDVSATAGV